MSRLTKTESSILLRQICSGSLSKNSTSRQNLRTLSTLLSLVAHAMTTKLDKETQTMPVLQANRCGVSTDTFTRNTVMQKEMLNSETV